MATGDWWDHTVANQFQRLELCLKHLFPSDNLCDFLDHEVTCLSVNKLVNFISSCIASCICLNLFPCCTSRSPGVAGIPGVLAFSSLPSLSSQVCFIVLSYLRILVLSLSAASVSQTQDRSRGTTHVLLVTHCRPGSGLCFTFTS